ncbi:MAG: toxin [Chlorobium sp.]|nr:toxin [Chlorobium sp.]
MKAINWNPEKNRKLITERKISFKEILLSMQSGGLLDDISHPGKEQYAHQRIFVIAVDEYAYLVPYVENEQEFFLKTIVPSCKATRQYLGDKK